MMKTLRKYMKHILWVEVLAFIATIVFSWGMGGFKDSGSQAERGIIGIVNGQKIQYQQFSMLLNQETEKAKEQAGGEELAEYRRNAIRDQVWNSIIQDILFAQEVKRLKLQATAEEIVFSLRNNPPDIIRSNEQFQTDGEFDMAKYQQALSDARNYDVWIPLENYLRSIIPIQKLQQQVLSTVRITDAELRETYRLENEKVNAKYLFIDLNDVSLENIIITDSEIHSYYQEHEEEYREPEKRKIEYVFLEGKPTRDDSAQTRYDAQDILDQINQEADFEELVNLYSKDAGTASKGGDLGFFGKGAMLKPFEEVAFAAKVGDVVGPVETQLGLHIIEILATKLEEGEKKVHARHILLKYETSPETYDALYEKAQYFDDEVMRTKGKHFTELAEQEELTVKETTPFQEGRLIPGIGIESRANHLVFQENIGWVSEPFSSNKNIFVFRISDIQKAYIKPLEEVKTTIERILQREKQKSKAGEICLQVWEKISGGMDFDAAAEEDSLEIKETGLFSLQSFVSGVGRDAPFSGAAFRLKTGQVSQPIEGARGYYILRVIERSVFDEQTFEAAKEIQKQTILQRKQQMVYMAWYNKLQEKADIKDYRNLYF